MTDTTQLQFMHDLRLNQQPAVIYVDPNLKYRLKETVVHHMITSLRVGRRMKKLKGVGGVGLRSTGCRSCRDSTAMGDYTATPDTKHHISEQRPSIILKAQSMGCRVRQIVQDAMLRAP